MCLYQLYEREKLARVAGENTNSFDFLVFVWSNPFVFRSDQRIKGDSKKLRFT